MAFCLAGAAFFAPALHGNQKITLITTAITSSAPRVTTTKVMVSADETVLSRSMHDLLNEDVIESDGVVDQTVASDPFITLLPAVSLAGDLLAIISVALRNR